MEPGPEQRGSERASPVADAQLFHQGAITRCKVLDLSAGGARIAAQEEYAPGTEVTLGLRLYDTLREAAGVDYLSFHLEVVEARAGSGGTADMFEHRMRNLTMPGSDAYERARRVVLAAKVTIH